ncbi:MAG: PD-(D/E)XK nuclease family protein [Proteobacteria bacterium]|nr:PD-(D/E)XK nuclease family protein [Pseudomonadota bacterium]
MNPVRIVPWSADFIKALASRLALEAGALDLSRTRIVFPHNRPARHLRAELAARADLPRPLLLPRMQALDEFLRGLRQELSPSPPKRAGKLDRIGLLHGVVRELGLSHGPLERLDDSARAFFPWGARLASLLEELARHGTSPQDIDHLEGAVLPWAEALLGQLGGIDALYKARMAQRGWTTPGLDALWLSGRLDEIQSHLDGERLVFAGFNALSPTEDAVLHRLWQQSGALVLWHTDPALALGGDVSWSAKAHGRLLRNWRTRAVLETDQPAPPAPPQVRRFYEGFDLHSQLYALERELAALPDTQSTAIVLPDPGALVPVMHHLPADEVNISMGYPLLRSSLAQLLETILVLHENREGEGRFHWRDLIALARHPLLRMLRAGDETPLRSAYQSWERHIRASSALQSPLDWPLAYDPEETNIPEEEIRALHREVLEACFTRFMGLTTLRQTGQAVAGLCDLLRRRGGDAWQHLLIDAECLLRLWQSVVPELTGSILADEPYDQPLLFLILRHLLEAERVSFEPEPLAGMQVLGMLETRLLRFRRLFLLDATEENLPGAAAPDPLLPDPLRTALGLPGPRERDNVAAHNFFRLLMGAEEVCVFYQAGVRPGALEGKSVRSRYVEQMLWDLERATGRLVRPQPAQALDAPLKTVSFPATSVLSPRPAVAVSETMRRRLGEHLRHKGVSPSALEDWLTCPKQAYFRRVLCLRPVREVAEDGDRALFGEIVHRVLRDYFTPLCARPINAQSLDGKALWALMVSALAADSETLNLPYDGRLALAAATRERLLRFVHATPATTVVALEHGVETLVHAAGMDIRLHGQIDRIDVRDSHGAAGHIVLDYKTGTVKDGGSKAWLDEAVFQRLGRCVPGSPPATDLLEELAKSGLDVQLPLYLHMLGANGAWRPDNAAWVALKSDGAERPFFPQESGPEEREIVIRQRVPALVAFLLEHLLCTTEFPARVGRHCQWCDYQGPCNG